MDRRERPAVARHRMMRRFAPLTLALLLAGCGGHSNVQLSSSALPSGGVSTGGAVQVQSQSALGVLLAIGVLMGASYASDRQAATISAPAMDSGRSVNEQDCTKPIVNWSANLRCK
jgi:hypothetical protein